MSDDEREQAVIDFSERLIPILSAKPVIAGSGCNFQRHCHLSVYAGIGFKFNDFIQSIHRIQRYQQAHPVEVWIVYAESEREVLASLQAKWTRHEEMVEKMSEIIREYGLSKAAMAQVLQRSIGVERIEASGTGWTVANNDCVLETRGMADDSVDLIVTSIPFANHYEYSPSYNDFGHTDDNAHFWAQMDHLSTQLLRILKPGRIAAIHVKYRIQFGAVTGAGVPTVSPFHAEAIFHYRSHGFDFMEPHHGRDRRVAREQPDLSPGLVRAVQGRHEDGRRLAGVHRAAAQATDRSQPRLCRRAGAQAKG
ncbi:hypothetical protein XA1311A_15320 [Xanthomonas arboricola]|uniref:hypothetical protein n=1 Tax=Xanthomonas arboricola TaxID=56448 RepID=UPI001E4258C1|nr:hypothetical protein [Xanthomonas arboricola]CAE6745191.1 hypothetical protein XA1311A_15320 [Xanthomonas arboricola]CAE6745203.1 hypothetical protein XA1311A_15320 [Xanthomonas arboricola]